MERPELTLSTTVMCKRCGRPLVEEWLAYWIEPAHGSCRQFAEALEKNPARFGLPVPKPEPEPAEAVTTP